jgi:hypothetical protein
MKVDDLYMADLEPGFYLRIIVHANEHLGQLVGYARMTGVAPPCSRN